MYLDENIEPFRLEHPNGEYVGTYAQNPGLQFEKNSAAKKINMDEGAGVYLAMADNDDWEDRGITGLDRINSSNLTAEKVQIGNSVSSIALESGHNLNEQGVVFFSKAYDAKEEEEEVEDFVVYVTVTSSSGTNITSEAKFEPDTPYYIGKHKNGHTSYFARTNEYSVGKPNVDDLTKLTTIDELREYTGDERAYFKKSDNPDMKDSSQAFLIKNDAHDFFIHMFEGFLTFHIGDDTISPASRDVYDIITLVDEPKSTLNEIISEINSLEFISEEFGTYDAYAALEHPSGVRYYEGVDDIHAFLETSGKSNAEIGVGIEINDTDWGPSDEIFVVLTEEKNGHIVDEVMILEDAEELFDESSGSTDDDDESIHITEDYFEDRSEYDIRPSLYDFEDPINEQTLMINIDLGLTNGETVEVYIDAEDIEFVEDVYRSYGATALEFDEDDMTMIIDNGKSGEAGEIELEWSDESTLKLTLIGTSNTAAADDFYVPLVYEVKGGTPRLEISGSGEIEEGDFALTRGEVGTEELQVYFNDISVVSTEGEGQLGSFEIKEIKKGALNDRVIKVELGSSDLEFVSQDPSYTTGLYDDKEFKVDGSYGYSSTIKKGTEDDHVTFVVDGENASIGYLVFENLHASASGAIEIEGLEIMSNDGKLPTGEIELTVSLVEQRAGDKSDSDPDRDTFWGIYDDYRNDDIEGQLDYDDDRLDETTEIISEIRNHALSMSVEEKINTIGGRLDKEYEVTVIVKDDTAEYLGDEGKVELTLEGAIFAPTDYKDEDSYYTTIDSDNVEDKTKIEVEEDAPNYVEFSLEGMNSYQTEFEFDITVIGNPGFNGDITLTADGSKWEDPLSVVIGEVSQPAEVSVVKNIRVVESIKAHPNGNISITETSKRMFEVDDVIAFKIEDLEIEDAEVTADNGLQVDYKVSDGYLLIQITRRSNNAATITISDIDFDGSNYIPVGEYSAFIGGHGMHSSNTFINFEESKTSKLIGTVDEDDDGDKSVEDQDLTNDYEDDKEEIFDAAFELSDFVVSERAGSVANGSSNQTSPSNPYMPQNAAGEDGNYGLPDIDISISYGDAFVNGDYAYTTSDLQDVNGVIMISISDLALLLGIDRDQEDGNTLNYYQSPDGTGYVIIRVGLRQLEIATGSNRMEIADYNALNGVYMPQGYLTFAQPAQVLYDNEGNPRTFVPIKQVGEALGFYVDWDPVTMTAVFTNVN